MLHVFVWALTSWHGMSPFSLLDGFAKTNKTRGNHAINPPSKAQNSKDLQTKLFVPEEHKLTRQYRLQVYVALHVAQHV